jgi:hypothetical protein
MKDQPQPHDKLNFSPLSLVLSERTWRCLKADADANKVDPAAICTKIVAEYYDWRAEIEGGEPPVHPPWLFPHDDDMAALLHEPQPSFSVARAFANYPSRSVALTQAFVDASLELPGVTAVQVNRSIVFIPRFVRIDYIFSARAVLPGFLVSFYGSKADFKDPLQVLKLGPKSFVRARITNKDELDYCRPFLSQSYERRLQKAARGRQV